MRICKWIIGAVLAVLFFICISGGGKQIAGITEKVVPFMGFFYIAVAMFVIVTHITLLPGVFAEIFRNAFDVKAIFGGFTGSAVMLGIREVFSLTKPVLVQLRVRLWFRLVASFRLRIL